MYFLTRLQLCNNCTEYSDMELPCMGRLAERLGDGAECMHC